MYIRYLKEISMFEDYKAYSKLNVDGGGKKIRKISSQTMEIYWSWRRT